MSRIPFKRHLVILACLLLALCIAIPIATFAQTGPEKCSQGKLCPLPIISPNQSQAGTIVPIPGTQPWTDTGIDLTQGASLSISASGTIYFSGGSSPYSPAGNPSLLASSGFVAPGLPVYSLVGEIGGGTPFEVGTSTAFSVATSGRLYLGVNDNYFPDNSGSWSANIAFTTTTALTVTSVFTRDGNGNAKNTFAPGNAIQYVVYVNNSSSQAITATLHFQAWGPSNTYIFDNTYTNMSLPPNVSGWYIQSTVPNNALSGTYTIQVTVTNQNNPQNQGTGQGQFTVGTLAYDAGKYIGKSGFVSVWGYVEPNKYQYRYYCGPSASQVLISAWTNKVPTLNTLATEEKTNPNPPHAGTLMSNMVSPINKAIGKKYYSIYHAISQGDFSNMLGRQILGNKHPLITGILTINANNYLNGWTVPAHHIITIYGFDFSSPSVGYIYYYETAGTVAGTTATGPNSIDYNRFWSLVQQDNIQLA